ncbi:MAG: Sec-independent protein translocase, TatC subunit [Solirubrobacterales bacterium]|jgi:sec-independent protein translocase protein TatC|nr:Sec-independent protein translocase, TatC subunit [Solirubrobacterales bacterium]
MKRSLRPIGHEDRLSLVDHLDELRNRLIISGVVLVVAFGFCFWQNHELLRIINKPLTAQTQKQVQKGQGTVGQAVLAQQAIVKTARDTSRALEQLAAPASGLSARTRGQLRPLSEQLQRDVAKIPRHPSGDKPVTLSVGEPFTTTITVALYFALIIALPVILFQLFSFILPALRPEERRATVPLLTAIPALFLVGVAFGYFIVLPAAVHFFVNFNADQFNNLVQANQFYKFAATILLAMGLVFQVPVVILGLTRLEIVTVAQLRGARRYAIVACAAIAAFLPGDVITLLLETVPLYLLYEASILLAAITGRARRRADAATGNGDAGSAAEPAPEPEPDHAEEPTVQQMIDHTDEDLS